MRLVNLLKSRPVAEQRKATPVPVSIAGGSYEVYEEWCLFNAKRKHLHLNEAPLKTYLQMVGPLQKLMQIPHGADKTNYVEAFTEKAKWARSTLKRDDRIIWYLNIVRYMYAKILSDEAYAYAMKQVTDKITPEDEANVNNVMSMTKKILRKVSAPYAVGTVEELLGQAGLVSLLDANGMPGFRVKNFITSIEQALAHSLSIDYEPIHQYVFGNQSWDKLDGDLWELEHTWASSAKQVIDLQKDPNRDKIEVVIQFPDGAQWVNLNRSMCNFEADAMGHCGNRAVNGSQQSVFSFRTPVNKDGAPIPASKVTPDYPYWKPHMTFIWNKDSQEFSEMKGRNNNKPDSKYHPYVLALLEQPWVHGIIPGGYKPEGNFQISDLSDSQRDALFDKNPRLMSIVTMINKGILDKSLMDKIGDTIQTWIKDDRSRIDDFLSDTPEVMDYENKKVYRFITFPTGENIIQFYKNIEGFSYISDFDYDDYDYDIPDDEREYALKTICEERPQALEDIQYLLTTNYADDIKESQLDLTDESDVAQFCIMFSVDEINGHMYSLCSDCTANSVYSDNIKTATSYILDGDMYYSELLTVISDESEPSIFRKSISVAFNISNYVDTIQKWKMDDDEATEAMDDALIELDHPQGDAIRFGDSDTYYDDKTLLDMYDDHPFDIPDAPKDFDPQQWMNEQDEDFDEDEDEDY